MFMPEDRSSSMMMASSGITSPSRLSTAIGSIGCASIAASALASRAAFASAIFAATPARRDTPHPSTSAVNSGSVAFGQA